MMQQNINSSESIDLWNVAALFFRRKVNEVIHTSLDKGGQSVSRDNPKPTGFVPQKYT